MWSSKKLKIINTLVLPFLRILSWSAHIETVVSKASQRVGIMKRLKYKLSRRTLVTLYTTLVRPVLENGSILYDNCTAQDSDMLEAVQLEAARVCTGALWNTSREKLLMELGWDRLHTRRKYFKLNTFYKIKHGLVPAYLQDFSLISTSESSPYNLRNPDRLRLPRARTNKYKNSFIPSVIESWNNLPSELINSATIDIFKTNLRAYLFTRNVLLISVLVY